MYAELSQRLTQPTLQNLLDLTRQLDIAPGPGGSRITDFHDQALTTLRSYLQMAPFDGAWYRAMVVALYPSAQLVRHQDAPIQGIRYHIPLQTNDGCWVHHAGQWHQLQPGHIYRMDPTEPHGAVNWGHDIRLHLVLDV